MASLFGCGTGARVEGMETPDAMRSQTVDGPPGPDPATLDVVPFLVIVPTVRGLVVESVDPPDVLQDHAPLEPAEVGVNSNGAVRKVLGCCRGKTGVWTRCEGWYAKGGQAICSMMGWVMGGTDSSVGGGQNAQAA